MTSPTWALAHTSQFAKPGWRYTQHGNGVDVLSNGGSIVTRVSPDGSDFSIVIEKMSTSNSACARGSNPSVATAQEVVSLALKGQLLAAAKTKGLTVWYSNLGNNTQLGWNPPQDQVFQKKSAKLAVDANGMVKLPVNVEEIYTITTLSTGNKGVASKPAPPSTPFPLPFSQDFDGEAVSAPPAYWYDQMGAWEVQAGGENGGNLMRQVSPVWPACWGYSCTGPTTYFGPAAFNTTSANGLTLALDVKLEKDASFTLGLGKTFYGLTLDSLNNTYTCTSAGSGGTKKGKASFATNVWHKITVNIKGGLVTATLDGKTLAGGGGNADADVDRVGGGSDGFYIVMSLDRYIYADVDNFKITV